MVRDEDGKHLFILFFIMTLYNDWRYIMMVEWLLVEAVLEGEEPIILWQTDQWVELRVVVPLGAIINPSESTSIYILLFNGSS